jgi:hypothetical protein
MWLQSSQLKKWRSDSLEARIYAIAEAEAHANGLTDGEAAGEAMEAVYRVMGWLAAGTQKAALEMIEESYGIKSSAAALSGFWQRLKPSWAGERMRRSSKAANDLAGLLDRGAVEDATLALLSQQAFEILTSPNPDPGDLVQLGKIILQSQKQAIDERRVALLEEKAKKADAAIDVMGSQLPEEEKARRIREILK